PRQRRWRRDARKLLQELGAPRAHATGQLRRMIREVEERRRRPELLSLKQHRGLWPEQEERGERAHPSRARLLAETPSSHGIGDLVVVFEKCHEARWDDVERRRATAVVLPAVPLSLVQEAVFRGRHEFLGDAAIAGV